MTIYQQWATDLRALANQLDILEPDLPIPAYPEQRLRIHIGFPERRDVEQVAKVLDGTVYDRASYQAHTDTLVGSVIVEWYWHDTALAALAKDAS